jgi:hypothetical protein
VFGSKKIKCVFGCAKSLLILLIVNHEEENLPTRAYFVFG